MYPSTPEPPRSLYPKLSGRAAREMGTERVAFHQRARLQGAMIAAVERRGYEAVSVSELVALAGVSKSVFYREFADKEECFLSTFEEIVRQGAEQIEAAYRSADGVGERLAAAFEAFVALAVENGPAVRLVFLASLELGQAALAARERAAARFEAMISQSLAEKAPGRPSPLAVRAIVGGTQEVVFRRLRGGEPERLAAEAPQLVAWALRYRPAAGRAKPSLGKKLVAEAAAWAKTAAPASGGKEAVGWEASPKSKRARKLLSQRERILRGAAQAVAETGYGSLSVAAIAARAGVSNQTFYQHFRDKEEAFLAAFDALAFSLFETTAAAFNSRQDWMEGGAAAIVALLSHLACHEMQRQLLLVELAPAGPVALERAEAMLDAFVAFLEPERLPPEASERPPRVVREAIAGGIWAVAQREAANGRGDALPDLAPEIADFALTAFGVSNPPTRNTRAVRTPSPKRD